MVPRGENRVQFLSKVTISHSQTMQLTRFHIALLPTLYLLIGFPLLSRPQAVFATRLAPRSLLATSLSTLPACSWSPSTLTPKSFPQNSSVLIQKPSSFSKNTRRLASAAASTKTPSPSNDDGEEEFIEDNEGIDVDNDEFEDDEEEDFGMETSTGGTDWGETILTAVRRLLSTDDTLEIYSFRVIARSKRVDIRLDKLTNKYGSPSLDEVGLFSRNLNNELEASLGEETAGEIEIEVSSPGAERLVKVPEEFTRFGEMPMLVEYDNSSADGGEEAKQERKKTVLQFKGVNDGDEEGAVVGVVSKWTLADVRANRSGKGRLLNKKQRETVIEIPIKDILKVNLHVDI